jgi:hypothetical protein
MSHSECDMSVSFNMFKHDIPKQPASDQGHNNHSVMMAETRSGHALGTCPNSSLFCCNML